MPELLNILTYPHKLLRKPAALIEAITPEVVELAESMVLTMKNSNSAVGLAAPQVGSPFRLIVIDAHACTDLLSYKDGPLICINPELTEKSESMVTGREGCLSFPDISVFVERHKQITLTYLNLQEEEKSIQTGGFLSRCIQHEIDHLDGITMYDRAAKVVQQRIGRKVKQNNRKNKNTPRTKKPPMANGTYWDADAKRYLQPSDPAYDTTKFKELTQ